MRRILVVDDDPHICLAIRAWLKRYGFKVAIADGGTGGLLALDNSTFDLMIVDVFMPRMNGFEFDQNIPRPCALRAADRDFRICLLQSRGEQPRLPEHGAQARRDALPAQAVQAHDIAQRDRRMPVGSRTPSQVCRHSFRRYQCAVRTAGQKPDHPTERGRHPFTLNHRASIDGRAYFLRGASRKTGSKPRCLSASANRWAPKYLIEARSEDSLATRFRKFGPVGSAYPGSGDKHATCSRCR